MAKVNLSSQKLPETSLAPTEPTSPPDSEYGGVWKNLVDGLLYELAELPKDKQDDGKITHHLRVPPQVDESGNRTHPGFTWAGTKEQFKDTFEKP